MVNFGGGMILVVGLRDLLRGVLGIGCGMSAICLRENNNKTSICLFRVCFPGFGGKFGGDYGGKCGGKLF